jgi:hypothetical protein
VLGAGNTSGDVIVDEIGHFVVVDQPIAGGEVDPGLPFLRRDIVADRSEVGRIVSRPFPLSISIASRASHVSLRPWTDDRYYLDVDGIKQS